MSRFAGEAEARALRDRVGAVGVPVAALRGPRPGLPELRVRDRERERVVDPPGLQLGGAHQAAEQRQARRRGAPAGVGAVK